jgi:hypothetical protein
LFRGLGCLDGVSRALRALGTAARRAGEDARAADLLEQACAAAQAVGDWHDLPVCLDRLYDVRPGRALDLCERVLTDRRAAGDAEHATLTLQPFGLLLLAQGEYGRAREELGEVLRWGRTADAALYYYLLPCTLLALGLVELALGHPERAAAWLGQSRELAHEAGAMALRDAALLLAASAALAQGSVTVAEGDTRACLERFHGYRYRTGAVCALVQMAGVAWRVGDLRRATTLLGAAGALGGGLDVALPWPTRVLRRWYKNAQRTIVEPALTAARAQLGDAEFEAAYAAGQQMTLDQAVADALRGDEAHD